MTLVTVLSIVAVVSVYAVIIGTFTGQDVTVKGVGSGSLKYSLNNVDSWASILTSDGPGIPWYSRLEIGADGYSGHVIITWQLEQEIDTNNWTPVTDATTTTNIVLNGSGGNIYATSDGVWAEGNYNWGAEVAGSGTYRVVASVDSV